MKRAVFIALLTLVSGLGLPDVSAQEIRNFDFDWEFVRLPADTADRTQWRRVDLPHDWSIHGSYSRENGDWQNGFLPGGVGIYRKRFDLPAGSEGKLLKILFDGVYRCSDVWINGHHLGYRPNGFIGFEYDLTPYVRLRNNVLEVRVDHSKNLSNRSYTGSGIYRHVWLKVVDPVHVPTWGVHFTARTEAGKGMYCVEVAAVNLDRSVQRGDLVLTFTDRNGEVVGENRRSVRLIYGDTITALFRGTIRDVQRWSPETPHLYTLKTTLEVGGKPRFECTEKVGFRDVAFSGDRGFLLNGAPVKIKGVCERSTAGALGAAVPDDVLYARLKQLKEMGCNAIRTSHHPFSPGFYDICDSLGLMVMDEIFDGWETPKAEEDYGLFFNTWWRRDVTDFVKRDRNRACVILWSIGNEVVRPTRETQAKIIALFQELDSTRLTTQGGLDPTRGMQGTESRTLLGVKGFNGDGEEIGVIEQFHARYPDVPIIGTEIPHTLQTRDVYRTRTHWRKFEFPAVWERKPGRSVSKEEYLKKMHPIPDLTDREVFEEEVSTRYYRNGSYYPIANNLPPTTYYQSSYDNASVRISARDSWLEVERLDYLSGTFRWTGFDYLGESNDWPSRFMNCGVIDICGFPKDHYYLYQSLWTDEPMVHLLPHWTHPGKEGVEIPVVAYTNAEEVELRLNGVSLGRRKNDRQQLVWMVPYAPGHLEAVAYQDGRVVASASRKTAGTAACLRLQADRPTLKADRTSVVQIAVEITDRQGVTDPHAEPVIRFTVSGGGRLIGTDNGDPLDLSDYKVPVRRAFRGKAMLWVQSDGTDRPIEVRATAEGLEPDVVRIDIEK